ncbi:MAG: hypothetical protein ABIL37_01225 [candidate division WOR-3 bacterium]
MEKVLIVYEEHHANHTNASTTFYFDPLPLEKPIFVGGRTHKKYMTIVKPGTKIIVKRISNRGNVSYKEIIAKKPMFIDFLGFEEELDEKYIRLAKEENLI